MTTLTISALVRSFISLIMTEDMSPRRKQLLVLGVSVIIFQAYSISTAGFDITAAATNFIEGLTAGLGALGVYNLTQPTKPAELG